MPIIEDQLQKRISGSDIKAIADVQDLIEQALSRWNTVDRGIQNELSDYFSQDASIGQCLLTASRTAEATLEMIAASKKPTPRKSRP